MEKQKIIADDIKNLSKYKYVYIFHKPYGSTSINTWSKERFPIVYINKKYIYFKRNGTDMLTYITRDDMIDLSKVEAKIQEPHAWSRNTVMYFLTKYEEDVDVIAEKVEALCMEEKAEKDRIAAKVSYAASKQLLESTIANMKRLEELYPELLDK